MLNILTFCGLETGTKFLSDRVNRLFSHWKNTRELKVKLYAIHGPQSVKTLRGSLYVGIKTRLQNKN